MESNSKPNIRLTVPFLGVADMEASLRFCLRRSPGGIGCADPGVGGLKENECPC